MKAVIFTRVSTRDQEDKHSLNAQLKRLQEYCHRQKFDIIQEYKVSESSTIGDRKQFKEMIQFVQDKSKKLKSPVALIVDSVDRLQRGFKECSLIDDLRKAKTIEIHFYKEAFYLNDQSSSSDIMRWDFGIIGAKMYVQAISDNVKRGNLYAWAKGLWTGKPPIGYKKISENGITNFVHDDLRAYYIKQIFELYSTELHSLMSLERKCKEWNLTSNKSIKGEPITKNTIDRILKDPFYYGEMYIEKYDRYYKHNYKPIIERWLFEKCKSITMKRNEQSNKQNTQISDKKCFIFSNLLTCKTNNRRVSCDEKEHVYLLSWDENNKRI
jgi:DNA invertase Pin-like site-specific DNA recombinase